MSNQAFLRQWRYIDHTILGLHFPPMHSFAYDDTFCTSVGENLSSSVIRSWIHPKTVVLGIQDSRLPCIKEGLTLLQENGFEAIVRNSGGLAVILDEGILNLSLIIKEEKHFSINDSYELMFQLIKQSLLPYRVTIEAKEIIGSYCPGSYDLSINNKKFAGISQRRIRGGIAVQIYLCVTGSGSNRAELIKGFYEKAIQGKETKFTYPNIQAHTMASLSELLSKPISTQMLMEHILQAIVELGGDITASDLFEQEQPELQKNIERIEKRNEKALDE